MRSRTDSNRGATVVDNVKLAATVEIGDITVLNAANPATDLVKAPATARGFIDAARPTGCDKDTAFIAEYTADEPIKAGRGAGHNAATLFARVTAGLFANVMAVLFAKDAATVPIPAIERIFSVNRKTLLFCHPKRESKSFDIGQSHQR